MIASMVLLTDKIVEHWGEAPSMSVNTEMSAAMTSSSTDCDTLDTGGDLDIAEIRSENEQKLAAMSETEILAKQQELLSALGMRDVTKFAFAFERFRYIRHSTNVLKTFVWNASSWKSYCSKTDFTRYKENSFINNNKSVVCSNNTTGLQLSTKVVGVMQCILSLLGATKLELTC